MSLFSSCQLLGSAIKSLFRRALLRVCQSTGEGTVWFGSHQRLATCSYSRSMKSRRRNRPKRDTSTKPVDKLQTNKERKVVREFYDSDTEKAYVDGLDLIDLFSEF